MSVDRASETEDVSADRTATGIDILMITYNRPEYTRTALSRLLETCDEHMRVWLWQNGSDPETLAVVEEFLGHPALYKYHHSKENKRLTEPTNWLYKNSEGDYVTKVDDDCLMPFGWGDTLRKAHEANPQFGVIGCWRFPDEDFIPEAANKKIDEFSGGHKVMRNAWVEGSGYVMKRECVKTVGLLSEDMSFTSYCVEVAKRGYINGWYFPFLYQDHFDDPRSPHSQIKSDAEMKEHAPLSALKNVVETKGDWERQLQRSARLLQETPYDVKHFIGWRRTLTNAKKRLRKSLGARSEW